MKKCVWCGDPIKERFGYKSIDFWSRPYRHGWLHRNCYPEWWSFYVMKLPQCIDYDGVYNGWLTAGNTWYGGSIFDFACGKIT